jgi:predicted porin
VGNAWEDYGNDGGESSFDLQYPALQGFGSVTIPYSQWVVMQLDLAGAASLDEGYGGSFFGGFGGDARVFYRDPKVGALGVYVGVGRANVGSTSSSDFAVWDAGIEGELYCNNWTLRAQAGYLDSDNNGWLLQEAGHINGTVIWYPGKHLKVSAGIGYAAGTARTTGGPSSFVDSDQWNWAVGAEYLFGKSIPVSVYVDYRGQDVENHYSGGDGGFTRNALNVGLRFPFGSGDDMMQNDREGVGYDPVDLVIMPKVGFF